MHTLDHGITENFFRWEGRLNRRRYLLRWLALTGAALALFGTAAVLITAFSFDPTHPHPGEPEDDGITSVVLGLVLLYSLPLTVSGYMLMIRRLHDLSMSGFCILMQFIPFLAPGLMIYLFCRKGTAGGNQYGPDPLAPARTPEPPT